ncbi:MAG: cytochrome-c peroxidase [Sandaracinaceae bacterium]|nr:cytochrome-c peroxidase [Sandaracinaceae bacterium]
MRRTVLLISLIVSLASLAACGKKEAHDSKSEPVQTATKPDPKSFFKPLAPVEVDEAKMQLGRKLYFDTRLSGDGTLTCASCHAFDKGGADGAKVSTGINGQLGPINSPTVLNSHLNFVQFWDGRAATLAEQALGPVENPVEMGAKWPEVVERLKQDEALVKEFAAFYEDGITKENVTDAIAEFERSLGTPAPFDRYLEGDEDAISDEAKRGLEVFVATGCTTCHSGEGLGGTMYQKMGLVQNYFELRGGEITEADLGRYNVTKNEADKHLFKVPLLRNIELTAPYFHDGSVDSLDEAVKIMAKVQLGRDLSDEDTKLIVAFLKTLTGELPPQASDPALEGAESEEG